MIFPGAKIFLEEDSERDLAEAQQLVLPHARDRMLHSADRWSKMADAADRRVR